MIKNRNINIIIIMIIMLNENLLRLIPINIMAVVSILGISVLIFKFKNIVEKRYIFKKYIIAINIICFLSAIGSYYMFGQPLIQGVFGMHFIFNYFIYFLFRDLLSNSTENDLIELKVKIVNFATIMAILYIIQAIIYPKIVIFNMSYAERSGRVRFFTGYIFIMFSIIIAYSILLKNFNKKILLNFCIQIFSLIIVSQTRNFILGIGIVLLYGLLISKKVNKIIVIYMSTFMIILYVIFLANSNNEVNNLILSLINEIKNKSGTIGTRFYELEFYIELLKKNIFLGCGLLYSRFELTPIITGYYPYYYFINDLGLIGVLIQTGILGMIWMVCFLKKIYFLGKKLINRDNSYLLRLTVVLIVGTFASGLIFDKGSIVYICLILAMEERLYKLKIL